MKTSKILALIIATAALPTLAVAGQSPFSHNPATVKAGTYTLDADHGKITWSVSHFGFSTYIGQFAGVSSTLKLDPKDLAKSKLTAKVAINSIGTLDPALNGMLLSPKFFDASAYPVATFVSTKIIRTGAKTADIDGNLTLHGVTKPVVIKAVFNQAGMDPMMNLYEVGFQGHMTLMRSAFGVSAFLPYIGNKITLNLEGEYHLKP